MTHRVVYFDLETAGLDPAHADIQLAAVATEDFVEVDSFEAKIVFDLKAADPEALKINSYDEAVWRKEARPERDVVKRFASFLSQHATIEKMSKKTGNPYRVAWLAGHNIASFDVPRLSAMFKRHDRFLGAEIFRPLDTMQLAWWYEVDPGNWTRG